MAKDKEAKDKEGQVIQYIEGFAWSINPKGETICIGTEDDIRTILANPRKHPSNPTIAQVISLERTLQKKQEEQEEKERVKKKKARFERFRA